MWAVFQTTWGAFPRGSSKLMCLSVKLSLSRHIYKSTVCAVTLYLSVSSSLAAKKLKREWTAYFHWKPKLIWFEGEKKRPLLTDWTPRKTHQWSAKANISKAFSFPWNLSPWLIILILATYPDCAPPFTLWQLGLARAQTAKWFRWFDWILHLCFC